MESDPEAPIPDVIEVMKETAHHPGGAELRPDNRWGFGMLDPLEAIRVLHS
jgi:serine protease AprX